MSHKKNQNNDEAPGLFEGLEGYADPPPAPAPRAARKNKKSDGHEVGRMMIRDLIAVHNRAMGRPAPGLLSLDERTALVNSLSTAKDIIKYNEMRNVHDYLVRASIMYKLHRKSAETEYWPLSFMLRTLLKGMQEQWPPLMSKAEAEREPPFGDTLVAIICGPKNEAQQFVDMKRQIWRPEHTFMLHNDEFQMHMISYRYYLREAAVVKAAVELIGRFIEVPQAVELVDEEGDSGVRDMNWLMEQITPLLVDERVKKSVTEGFQPLDLKALEPKPQAREAAFAYISFNTVQGYEEELYKILRGEAATHG